MSKIKKISATEPQILALIEILNEFSAGLGSGQDDDLRITWVKRVDKLLNTNGIFRNCK